MIDKYVAQLQEDTGATAKNIVEAAGEQGATLLPPIQSTDKGKYLHTNESTGALEWTGVNGVPAVETTDKDKYLHTNAETGALEWREVSGGGTEFFVVTFTNHYTLNAFYEGTVADKTYTELQGARNAGIPILAKIQTQMGTNTPVQDGYLLLYEDVTGFVACHVMFGYPDTSTMTYDKYLITYQDEVSKTSNIYTLTPAP